FGAGVNTDAGLVGSIVLNERNFDPMVDDTAYPNYRAPEVGPIMCGSCAFEEAAVEEEELLPEEEEAAGGRMWFYEGFRRCGKQSSRTIVPEQLDVMPTEESEESEVDERSQNLLDESIPLGLVESEWYRIYYGEQSETTDAAQET